MLLRRDRITKGNDIITVYRPRKISELIGNHVVKKSLHSYMTSNNLPHTLLFSGPSGCGKTTIARIVAAGLNCEKAEGMTPEPCLECSSCLSIMDGVNMSVSEINVGKDSGKADIDKVISTITYAPMGTKKKVIIFDEAHVLTVAAKNMLLKVMEDSYQHVYIIFCTDEPDKLINVKKIDDPFLRRCTWLRLAHISDSEMLELLDNISTSEGVTELNDEIKQFILDKSKGVPSNALKFLGMCINEGSYNLANIKELVGEATFLEDTTDIRDICRLLLKSADVESVWVTIFAILDKLLKTASPEAIRIGMCGYFVKCLKGSNINTVNRASMLLDILLEPILYDVATSKHKLYNMVFKSLIKVN